jgi:uncharacterized protein (AIM24 family)
MAPSAGYTCPWCRAVSDGQSGACPGCGAPVDVRTVVTSSGWYEMPPIKDMARIQAGASTVQIEGKYVPVADFNLAPGDTVYFTHHLLLWRDLTTSIGTMPMRGGWKRMFAGLPLIMTQATGPGHAAFSKDKPGEMVALPLQAGQAVDMREHVFLVATGSVAYDWFQTNVWFQTSSGNEVETHYPLGMFMDRFVAPQAPGLVLIHASGNSFVRYLQPGEHVLVKPTALLFKDTTVHMALHFEHPAGTWRSWRSWGERYVWLRLTGPGRVAVESAFEPMEDRPNNLRGWSQATRRQW